MLSPSFLRLKGTFNRDLLKIWNRVRLIERVCLFVVTFTYILWSLKSLNCHLIENPINLSRVHFKNDLWYASKWMFIRKGYIGKKRVNFIEKGTYNRKGYVYLWKNFFRLKGTFIREFSIFQKRVRRTFNRKGTYT